MADGVEVVVCGVKELVAGMAKAVGVVAVVGGGNEASAVRSRWSIRAEMGFWWERLMVSANKNEAKIN